MADLSLEPRTFKVTGMTCNACVNSVERSLNSMPGVSATVNFAAETAHVLAPAEITAKEIIKKIESAGYEGKEIGDNEAITLHSKKSAIALIFATIFTVPVVLFSMSMNLQMTFGNWIVETFKYFDWTMPTKSVLFRFTTSTISPSFFLPKPSLNVNFTVSPCSASPVFEW